MTEVVAAGGDSKEKFYIIISYNSMKEIIIIPKIMTIYLFRQLIHAGRAAEGAVVPAGLRDWMRVARTMSRWRRAGS